MVWSLCTNIHVLICMVWHLLIDLYGVISMVWSQWYDLKGLISMSMVCDQWYDHNCMVSMVLSLRYGLCVIFSMAQYLWLHFYGLISMVWAFNGHIQKQFHYFPEKDPKECWMTSQIFPDTFSIPKFQHST